MDRKIIYILVAETENGRPKGNGGMLVAIVREPHKHNSKIIRCHAATKECAIVSAPLKKATAERWASAVINDADLKDGVNIIKTGLVLWPERPVVSEEK